MKTKTFFLALVVVLTAACAPSGTRRDDTRDVNIRIDKVWGNGEYCAFTSLIKFQNRYYIAFRESDGHIWGDDNIANGTVRILRSEDGLKWESVALFQSEGGDLRDPNLSITPDGRLMVNFLRAVYDGKIRTSGHSYSAFSNDGKEFTEIIPSIIPEDIASGYDWLWKTTWYEGTGYSVMYSSVTENGAELIGRTRVYLMKTQDGVDYSEVCRLDVPEEKHPNEAAVHFLSDGTMCMVLRMEKGDGHALWGRSKAPYTDWDFTSLGIRVGGPDFTVTPDDRILLSTRTHYLPGSFKTVVLKGTPEGRFTEVCLLPSSGAAGDSSYAGLLIEGDELWLSYYSSLEGAKPSIYLARIPMKVFDYYMK